MSDRLKVMMLSSEYPPTVVGGLGTHVHQLASGLAASGSSMTVLAFTRGPASVIQQTNLDVHLLPPGGSPSTEIEQSSVIDDGLKLVMNCNQEVVARARRLMAQGLKPDVIHGHDWLTFPAARELGETFEIPVVVTLHILSTPMAKLWGLPSDPEVARHEQALCREADALITVSASMAALVREFHDVSLERLHVVYNGFDVDAFCKSTLTGSQRRSLRQTVAPDQEKIILFAGRLTPQKGITALFKAADIVVREYPHVRYLLVGEPDYLEAVDMLESLKKEHRQVMEKTKLLGKLPRAQVALLYSVADLALIPSVYEPFGYAATEAMAAGVPVVATRVGGLAEIIEDGSSGLLVPVLEQDTGLHEVDVEALALAQLRVLQDQALAQRLSTAGHERVRTTFSLERMVNGTRTVYKQVLARHRDQHALPVT